MPFCLFALLQGFAGITLPVTMMLRELEMIAAGHAAYAALLAEISKSVVAIFSSEVI